MGNLYLSTRRENTTLHPNLCPTDLSAHTLTLRSNIQYTEMEDLFTNLFGLEIRIFFS